MELRAGDPIQVADQGRRCTLSELAGRGGIHAIAGIGDPERFFGTLEKLGVEVERRPFPDHHGFSPKDIDPPDDQPVVMTEKDAVKCVPFAGPRHWFLPVEAQLDSAFWAGFDSLIDRLIDGQKAA